MDNDIFFDNFKNLMQKELLNNDHKGDFVKDWNPDCYQLIAETAYHLAKLNKAMLEVERGTDLELIKKARQEVREYSADVANYMAKTNQMFGN